MPLEIRYGEKASSPIEETGVDLGAWLRGLELGQYEQLFQDHRVDWDVLPHLTVDDLRDMGVVAVGQRRKLLAAIAAEQEHRFSSQTQSRATRSGTSTSGPAPGPTSSEAERRQLTVMFVDLVGSTALAARLDPEEMRDLIQAYQDAVAVEIKRFDGYLARFMGDGVLAYFCWPLTQEDEAERSVRAGATRLTQGRVGSLWTHGW